MKTAIWSYIKLLELYYYLTQCLAIRRVADIFEL